MNDDADRAAALRGRMVDRVTAHGWARDRRVAEAMRTVPRHLFVPDATVDEAYDDQAVITKRDRNGVALSCASEPVIVAMMLDQLAVRPGQRILEIGAGTGYNAALLQHLTGPTGQVSTVDVDPEVTARTRHALDHTGNRHVHVATGDGTLGDPDHAPYDRIILTVATFDLPPAWWQQLTPGGRLVAPLRWRGQTRSVALTHHGDTMRSDSIELCGFVPMIGQDAELAAHLDADQQVTLHWDPDQPIRPDQVADTLSRTKTAAWSTVTVAGDEPFDGIWLQLTSTEPGTCRITAQPAAVTAGRCTPAIPSRSPAVVDGTSLAYLTLRRTDPSDGAAPRWELGATGHGPAGQRLAHTICEAIRAWNLDRTNRPTITVRQHHGNDPPLCTAAIRKQHTAMTLSRH